ncbi:MAG: hypothetical protein JWM16_1840 [Verrucomicrobiales bacterium]|nr:hypothetical protein [Verrucomicrobiales bacterium]
MKRLAFQPLLIERSCCMTSPYFVQGHLVVIVIQQEAQRSRALEKLRESDMERCEMLRAGLW